MAQFTKPIPMKVLHPVKKTCQLPLILDSALATLRRFTSAVYALHLFFSIKLLKLHKDPHD
jgi:hypothetical protein